MLKMRLSRHGRTKRPNYRIVVAEHTAPRDGLFLENVGTYNPLTNPATVQVKAERVQHWLSHGARPTATVHHLLAKQGLIAPLQAKPLSKKVLAKRQAAAEAKAAAETESAS